MGRSAGSAGSYWTGVRICPRCVPPKGGDLLMRNPMEMCAWHGMAAEPHKEDLIRELIAADPRRLGEPPERDRRP
jgi:hypothetical protein